MKVYKTIAQVRADIRIARENGMSVALVPTMGALHDGHLSLIQAAAKRCDVVLVSIFVNPTQFNEAADFAAYPRSLETDADSAQHAGATTVFAPAADEIYPAGFHTTVDVGPLGEVFEGASRPGHFAGVCTVVAKLLNIVDPDIAVFGQKDAQQVAVVSQMVRELNFRAEIVVMPTIREADGLAMSSRNVRLSPREREQAVALSRSLETAQRAIDAGERDARRVRDSAVAALHEFGVQPEYFEVVDGHTMRPIHQLNEHTAAQPLAIVAARVGTIRLIDNAPLNVPIVSPALANTRATTPAIEQTHV